MFNYGRRIETLVCCNGFDSNAGLGCFAGSLVEKRLCFDGVMDIAARQDEGGKIAEAFDCGVDLGCQATAGPPESLWPVFFAAPLAC